MRSHSVGYFSSYDRGLITLLEMWPKIREAVPDSTLDIYYGWNGFDEAHRSNPKQMKWKWDVIRLLHDLKELGVAEHGRVSHEELAAEMKRIKVWAYPTSFAEINCITAIKAQAAGMIPVTTHCYALKETVLIDEPEVTDIDTNPTAKAAFIKRVIVALNSNNKPDPKPALDRFNWDVIAGAWDDALR